MYNQALVRDPSLQRLVQDFDALADLVQTLIDHDQHEHLRPEASDRHESFSSHETEFTTEWQMEVSVEDVSAV